MCLRRIKPSVCASSRTAVIKVLVGVLVFGEHFNKAIFHQMIARMHLFNTGITYVRRTEKSPRWELLTWNDQSHLG